MTCYDLATNYMYKSTLILAINNECTCDQDLTVCKSSLCAVSAKPARSRDNQAVDTYLLAFKLSPIYNNNKLPI